MSHGYSKRDVTGLNSYTSSFEEQVFDFSLCSPPPFLADESAVSQRRFYYCWKDLTAVNLPISSLGLLLKDVVGYFVVITYLLCS